MYVIEKYKGSGCASSFYKLKGKKRGFKEFTCKEAAIVAHYNQSKLASFDLSPRVYSEVGKIRSGNRLSRWGYITEIATLLCCPGNECYCCDREELEDEISSDMNELLDAMENVGFCFGDNHIANVGYVIRKGMRKLVCIDTGDESVSCDDGPCFCLVCKKGGNCRDE